MAPLKSMWSEKKKMEMRILSWVFHCSDPYRFSGEFGKGIITHKAIVVLEAPDRPHPPSLLQNAFPAAFLFPPWFSCDAQAWSFWWKEIYYYPLYLKFSTNNVVAIWMFKKWGGSPVLNEAAEVNKESFENIQRKLDLIVTILCFNMYSKLQITLTLERLISAALQLLFFQSI